MSVYVDEIHVNLVGRLKRSCHLMADTDVELEEFASRLQVPKSWKHGDHYDLSPARRVRAVRDGAVEVTSRDLVILRKENRRV